MATIRQATETVRVYEPDCECSQLCWVEDGYFDGQHIRELHAVPGSWLPCARPEHADYGQPERRNVRQSPADTLGE